MAKEKKEEEIVETIQNIKLKNPKDLNLRELLELKDAVKFVYDYYDNLARSSYGSYDIYHLEQNKNATEIAAKYNDKLMALFNIIVDKVNEYNYEE